MPGEKSAERESDVQAKVAARPKPIRITCSACDANYDAQPTMVGRAFRCKCGVKIPVHAPVSVSDKAIAPIIVSTVEQSPLPVKPISVEPIAAGQINGNATNAPIEPVSTMPVSPDAPVQPIAVSPQPVEPVELQPVELTQQIAMPTTNVGHASDTDLAPHADFAQQGIPQIALPAESGSEPIQAIPVTPVTVPADPNDHQPGAEQ